jgi:AMIN domain-containing protein
MRSFNRRVLGWVLISAGGPFFLFGATFFAVSEAAAAPQAEVKIALTPIARLNQVTVTFSNGGVEVEIASSRSVPLRSQVLTGPDRLILDFPDTLPGHELHDQNINQGQVKAVRVGLFAHNPPVTRVVIDLKSAQPYRIYPSGKTVIVRLLSEKQAVAALHPNDAQIKPVVYTPPVPAKPVPVLNVDFQNDRMGIVAHDVSLAQVLSEVQRKTGADIPIPSVAAQEHVVADIGMLPVRDALTALLNGSRFNFIMVGADNDPSKLKSLILTFRAGGISQPAIASPPSQPAVVDAVPEPEPAPADNQPQPEMQAQPEPQPEPQAQPQEGQGQQESPASQDGQQPPPQ